MLRVGANERKQVARAWRTQCGMVSSSCRRDSLGAKDAIFSSTSFRQSGKQRGLPKRFANAIL